jgi:hypothetical protein
MNWTGHVWQQAGRYGALGSFEPQRGFGQHTFVDVPAPGTVVELRGKGYQVTDCRGAHCYVRPVW